MSESVSACAPRTSRAIGIVHSRVGCRWVWHVALGSVVLAGSLQAQEAGKPQGSAPELEEVVVTATGTNISGVAPVGVQTVTVTREEMLKVGADNVAEVVRTLPQIQNLGFDEAVRENGNANQTGNSTRGTALNLRGLGATATLVLVDGHRLAPAGAVIAFTEAVQVPFAAVERIEVVPDGASAVYGSDAIAGVVNYVLRKDFNGVEVNGRYSSNKYQGDWTGSVVGGTTWQDLSFLGHGNVILSYEHYRQNPALRGSLPYYRQDLSSFGGLDNRVLTTNSTPGASGNIRVGNQPNNTVIRSAGGNTYYGIPASVSNPNGIPSLAEVQQLTNKPDLLDRSDFEDYVPTTERDQVALLLNQDINSWLSAFYEGFYTNRETTTRTFYSEQAAATVEIPINPGTPYYISPALGTPAFAGGPPGAINLQYNVLAHAPAGVRFASFNPEKTFSHTAGLRAQLPAEWNAEWHYTYGTVRNCGICYFDFFVNADPGNALSRAVNEGFINPYSTAPLTQAQWDRIRGSNIQRSQDRMSDTVLKFDGPLFTLPGGRMRSAVGLEYSRQVNRLQNGANRSPGFSGQIAQPGTPDAFVWDAQAEASREQTAAFAELFVPIVGVNNSVPFVKALNLSGAYRYDHYSDFGSTANPKLGVTWDLNDQFTLRASRGTAFRAPALQDLNNGLFSYAVVTQAVNNANDPSIPIQIAIPGVVNLTNVLLYGGSNPNLGPEKGKTWTVGFDFTPAFVHGLRVSGTYYNIKYNNQIGGLYQGQYLNSAASRAIYAPLITPVAADPHCVPGDRSTAPAAVRAVLENPNIPNVAPLPGLNGRSFLYGAENLFAANLCDVRAILDARTVNAAKTEQNGIDLQVNYAFSALSSFWNLGFSGSKILNNDRQLVAGTPTQEALDLINFPVSLRARTTFSWNRGAWGAALFGNYVGSYLNNTPIQGQTNTEIPSWTTADVNVSYAVPERTGGYLLEGVRVGLTAQNVTDRAVPIVLTGSTANDARNHNPLGRIWQFSVTKDF